MTRPNLLALIAAARKAPPTPSFPHREQVVSSAYGNAVRKALDEMGVLPDPSENGRQSLAAVEAVMLRYGVVIGLSRARNIVHDVLVAARNAAIKAGRPEQMSQGKSE